MKHWLWIAVLMSLAPSVAYAEVQTQTIEYNDGEVVLEGYLAWDDAHVDEITAKKAPGILIVHQWMGLTHYEKLRARQLAEMGYVVFALDIYGRDHKPNSRQEAGETAGKYKNDRDLFRKRLNLGLEQLKQQPTVDNGKIAAIGYCFGGTGVLELARSGADIRGVVSFHGGLDSPAPEDGKNIKASILICHGADDPLVSQEGIAAMRNEFDDAHVDWQMIYYSGAVHSFTDPAAGDDKAGGVAYHKKADERSWKAMQAFFEEIFSQN